MAANEEKYNQNYAVRRVFFVAGIDSLSIIKHGTVHLNVVGPQVRALRQRKGWSQDQLAVKLQLIGWDTSQDSVSRLENQSRRVADLELFVLAEVLDTKLDTLFPQNIRTSIKALWPQYRIKLSRGQLPPSSKS